MTRRENIQTAWTEFRGVARVLRHVRLFLPSSPWNPARLVEERAREAGSRPALLFEDRRYSWSEVDGEVNRAARAFRSLGIAEGEVVAILMDNRPEFLFALNGLNRIRAGGALINTNITGPALAHALRVAEPTMLVIGSEHTDKLEAIAGDLGDLRPERIYVHKDEQDAPAESYPSFDTLLSEQTTDALDDRPIPSVDDRFGYIYTSGTTGLPKAAIITNRRILMPGTALGRGIFELTPDDVLYVTTPLYHSVGIMVGWGGVLTSGATLALRRKFSASRFWEDVCRFEATVFVYIGELCRYLLNQPEHPDEKRHRLRLAGGNGLRPDIWEKFQSRFGIPLIREYYGATEGSSMSVNMTGRPGMVGRLAPGNAILRCDLETGEPWRGPDGRCQAVGPNETGLLVAPISAVSPFDGYSDAEASKKKILEGVFRQGDRFFNTGDLLTLHPNRWLSFADRVGDTFRWKGENVSTNEVAEILNRAPGVLETNVYGVMVPRADGRAGMASVHHGADFSIEEFASFVLRELPGYMRPHFVRLQSGMRITGTFKHQKVDYRREGFDPTKVDDPLYLLEEDRYIELDEAVFSSLQEGSRQIR